MSQLRRTIATPLLVPRVWDIDPGHSSVEFVARHLLSRVRGRFTEFGGTIEVRTDPAQSSAVVTIQATRAGTRPRRRTTWPGRPVGDTDRSTARATPQQVTTSWAVLAGCRVRPVGHRLRPPDPSPQPSWSARRDRARAASRRRPPFTSSPTPGNSE